MRFKAEFRIPSFSFALFLTLFVSLSRFLSIAAMVKHSLWFLCSFALLFGFASPPPALSTPLPHAYWYHEKAQGQAFRYPYDAHSYEFVTPIKSHTLDTPALNTFVPNTFNSHQDNDYYRYRLRQRSAIHSGTLYSTPSQITELSPAYSRWNASQHAATGQPPWSPYNAQNYAFRHPDDARLYESSNSIKQYTLDAPTLQTLKPITLHDYHGRYHYHDLLRQREDTLSTTLYSAPSYSTVGRPLHSMWNVSRYATSGQAAGFSYRAGRNTSYYYARSSYDSYYLAAGQCQKIGTYCCGAKTHILATCGGADFCHITFSNVHSYNYTLQNGRFTDLSGRYWLIPVNICNLDDRTHVFLTAW